MYNFTDLSCSAGIGELEETVVDCSGSGGISLHCSFNDGPLHSCKLPNRRMWGYLVDPCIYTYLQCVGNVSMVLTSNVSPPGSYSVRIVAGSGVEETVTYTITDTDTDGKKFY